MADDGKVEFRCPECGYVRRILAGMDKLRWFCNGAGMLLPHEEAQMEQAGVRSA